jgi:outer membrane lipoprotein-sorting protein
MRPTDNINRLIKKLQLKASAYLDRRVLGDFDIALAESEKTESADAKPNRWRIIMKSPITKLAAAAVIIIAVLIGIHQFGGSIEGTSLAFADVLEKIQNTKTLTWKTTFTQEGQKPQIARAMLIEPHFFRYELPDGQVWIFDHRKRKTLVLDPAKKMGTVYSADKGIPNIYNAFRNFRDLPDFSVKELGKRQVDGKEEIGFYLSKENEKREITVWVDPETQLPVRIEETVEDAQGNTGHAITTDIVFGAELDESLFSFEPPEGYKLQDFDYGPINRIKNRTMSALNMDRILKACREYVNEHNGQWPDNLEDLAEYGLDKDVFTNPRQPAREVGYIYLKPPVSPSESRIVLYEAYDVWDGGINIGFADYHVQFIKQESDFKSQLAKPFQR